MTRRPVTACVWARASVRLLVDRAVDLARHVEAMPGDLVAFDPAERAALVDELHDALAVVASIEQRMTADNSNNDDTDETI